MTAVSQSIRAGRPGTRLVEAWTDASRLAVGQRVESSLRVALGALDALSHQFMQPEPLVIGLLLDEARAQMVAAATAIAMRDAARTDVGTCFALSETTRRVLIRTYADPTSVDAVRSATLALAQIYRWLADAARRILGKSPPDGASEVAGQLERALGGEVTLAPELFTADSIYGETVAALYDELRPRPSEFRAGIERIARRYVMGQKTVEVGAGTGRVGEVLLAYTGSYVGVDLSPDMLDRFRGKLGRGDARVTLRVADALGLPFGDASIDVIVEHEALYFTADPLRAADETIRVLRPGGVLLRLITDSGPDDPLSALLAAFREGVAAHRGYPFYFRGTGSDEQITAHLRDRGLHIEEDIGESWDEPLEMERVEAGLRAGAYAFAVGIPPSAVEAGIEAMREDGYAIGVDGLQRRRSLRCLICTTTSA